jgi:hypothetical protein
MKFGIFVVAYFTTHSVTGPYIGRSVIKILSLYFSGRTAEEQVKCVSTAMFMSRLEPTCLQPYRLTQPARFQYADRS